MPLVPFKDMMANAERGKYAVGYFESWNLESLLAVADAAEAARSPAVMLAAVCSRQRAYARAATSGPSAAAGKGRGHNAGTASRPARISREVMRRMR